ncbi:hypothetical protein GCM10011444_23440 [Winogradskyella haliclonae]|uniref:Glycosyltransferase n=2 Tax=Winogradskyella haliclonae TaxID=2048558 RepID=A0ABQ2BZX2_9FLAO|nr:hypothetical protein GCM10011444_23440 [Winogradskyella haliclonae]
MVELLAKDTSVDLEINGLKESDYKSTVKVQLTPNYFQKRLYERFYGMISKAYNGLSYLEIKWLQNKVNIVHLHHSFLFKYFNGISKLNAINRPKLIVTLRGSDTYLRPWYDKRWVDFYKNSSDRIDAFVVMSQHQKNYLQKWGVSEAIIEVIPASIKKSNHSPRQLDGDIIKIVSSFRMTWEKNIEGNLRVIKYLVDKGYNVSYDVYGKGHDIGEVYFMVDKYGLHDIVNIKGKVENDEYLKQLKTYDFYLQLSKSESLSISTIEAQSFGLPAIISDAGGMPETILDEKSGYAVPFYESDLATKKIERLINNKVLYQQFSEAAIANVKHKFTNLTEAESYINLYKKLTENA